MSMAAALESHLLLVDGFVVGMLLGGEPDPDDDFLLLRQILNILLHPAQQKWTQRLLQRCTTPGIHDSMIAQALSDDSDCALCLKPRQVAH